MGVAPEVGRKARQFLTFNIMRNGEQINIREQREHTFIHLFNTNKSANWNFSVNVFNALEFDDELKLFTLKQNYKGSSRVKEPTMVALQFIFCQQDDIDIQVH